MAAILSGAVDVNVELLASVAISERKFRKCRSKLTKLPPALTLARELRFDRTHLSPSDAEMPTSIKWTGIARRSDVAANSRSASATIDEKTGNGCASNGLRLRERGRERRSIYASEA